MTADDIQTLFTRKDGQYLCSRWGRPIVPVVFGVDDATLATVKGAIEAVVTLADLPAEVLALNEAVQVILLWGEAAFSETSPLARAGETVILRPEIAVLIRAAYDPVLPAVARDASHALRLAARL